MYSQEKIDNAANKAREFLLSGKDGFPRTHEDNAKHIERRGYDLYDGHVAPPIYGYEALEKAGLARRIGLIKVGGEHRIRFEATDKLKGII